jgi:hypothetical protein
MQILHRFSGSIQQYLQEISDPDHYRPGSCPQCQASCPLQLVFAIQQAFTAAILAVTHEQVEGEKAWIISTMKEQVSELWPSFLIE